MSHVQFPQALLPCPHHRKSSHPKAHHNAKLILQSHSMHPSATLYQMLRQPHNSGYRHASYPNHMPDIQDESERLTHHPLTQLSSDRSEMY